MKDKQIVFYAFLISGTIHLAGIGVLGGLFDFPIKQSMPKTQIVEIDRKKSPLLPEIRVIGEVPKIVSQQKKQEVIPEPDKLVLNASAGESKPEISAEEIRAEQAMLRYQDMIKQRIEKFRRYPLRAQRNQTQGMVDLKFSVFANGAAGSVQISRSSGSEMLDTEALNTIQRASPFLPIPDEIAQNMITISVAIIFSLD
ncbi:MAG: energy transducer TonB [Candidatus Omnitrophica bacterium]|nr:energy transducer TonB [Candidatus Omnitrophota bacterium]